jgi:hypothetical protein
MLRLRRGKAQIRTVRKTFYDRFISATPDPARRRFDALCAQLSIGYQDTGRPMHRTGKQAHGLNFSGSCRSSIFGRLWSLAFTWWNGLAAGGFLRSSARADALYCVFLRARANAGRKPTRFTHFCARATTHIGFSQACD